jgi:plastocyanin
MLRSNRLTRLAAIAAMVWAGAATAQPVDGRTPGLEGAWTAPTPHTLLFRFSHRFEIAGDDGLSDVLDDGKVVNYPTFALDYALARPVTIGVRYSSNSLIAGRVNEWQPLVRVVPLANDRAAVAATVAWNAANESVDGELTGRIGAGPLTVLGAVRGFSSPLDRETDEAELALAAGATLALNRNLALTADYANMVTEPDVQIAWSAGVTARIPYTPHTLSFFATNVSSGTLEGASAGVDGSVLAGFEFTVPFSGQRWGKIFRPDEAPAAAAPAQPAGPAPRAAEAPVAGGAVVEIVAEGLKFDRAEVRVPVGTTVRWVNKDPLAHTTTAEGVWDSGLVEPGGTFEFTFTKAGTYNYICTPHPFMKGTIVVEEAR